VRDRRVIFRARVGSHLYGLNTPQSDEDFVSVFIPSNEDILGLNKVEMINESTKSSSEDRRNTVDDIDDVSYSLPKFLKLLLGNNPNIVELLFTDEKNTLICEPEFQVLRDNYDKFISTKVFHTFTGYAFSQKKKLVTKKERYGNLVRACECIEDIYGEELNHFKDDPCPISDQVAINLNKWVKYYKGAKNNCESFHKGMDFHMIYSKLITERDNYGWRVKTDTFETLGYDVKFAYHLIRILHEGIQLLSLGKLEYPNDMWTKQTIMKIRHGDVSYEELTRLYDEYDALAKEVYEISTVRKKPDFNWANKYLIKTLEKSIGENNA